MEALSDCCTVAECAQQLGDFTALKRGERGPSRVLEVFEAQADGSVDENGDMVVTSRNVDYHLKRNRGLDDPSVSLRGYCVLPSS